MASVEMKISCEYRRNKQQQTCPGISWRCFGPRVAQEGDGPCQDKMSRAAPLAEFEGKS